MRAALAIVVVSVGLALAAAPAGAHHAFAATYDTSKPVQIKGVITKIDFVNPHSWFWLDVKNSDGTVTNWGFEGGSPNSLFRNGVTKNSVPVGTELVIQGYQSKAFPNKGVGINITFPDGRKFLLGGATPGGDSAVAVPNKDDAPKSDPPKSN
jgi:hypothetical protein